MCISLSKRLSLVLVSVENRARLKSPPLPATPSDVQIGVRVIAVEACVGTRWPEPRQGLLLVHGRAQVGQRSVSHADRDGRAVLKGRRLSSVYINIYIYVCVCMYRMCEEEKGLSVWDCCLPAKG